MAVVGVAITPVDDAIPGNKNCKTLVEVQHATRLVRVVALKSSVICITRRDAIQPRHTGVGAQEIAPRIDRLDVSL